MKKIIIIVLALSVVLGFLFWKFGPNFSLPKKETGPITLTYWGLLEDENAVKPLLDQYQAQHPNIKITYQRQSMINYRTRVQTQIKESVGPDILMFHNSWLTMMLKEDSLIAAPADVFSLAEYKTSFYPVAEQSFTKDNLIYGVPAKIDGLALFINEDILNPVGGKEPKNWQEFIDLATKMTVKDETGQIKTAGAGMGTSINVDHFSDILGLLLLQQPGVDLKNPATQQTADVLRFYTGFVTDPKKKTWDINLPSSTQMFKEGKLGFYFAPSFRVQEISDANPNLNFKVVPVPQLSGKPVDWANFWGLGVSAKSKFHKEAWQLVKFLASQEQDKEKGIMEDPKMGAFITQGPDYKFWYLASNTQDLGINEEMIKLWGDAISATLSGSDPKDALQNVAKEVPQILDKYSKQPTASPK